MDEMVRYIFGALRGTEVAFKHIEKNLKLQNKFNNRVALFSVVVVAQMVITNKIIMAQGEKIKKLNEEIEKMRGSTESCEESTESAS